MENNKKLTVWQRLSKTFGPDSTLGMDAPTYTFDKKDRTDIFLKEDLKGLSKTEIELLKDFNINAEETTNDRLKKYIS